VSVSLATVYNTLHQFADVGLLRQVVGEGPKTLFDTNASDHHHFLIEEEGAIIDIPNADVAVAKATTAPEGYEIARVDLVVRLRKRR
jgi:Fur family iron response transcriptional regulator